MKLSRGCEHMMSMKKLWLSLVGLAALGLGAPASAADLAVRPYRTAVPPMVAAIYDLHWFERRLGSGPELLEFSYPNW